MIMFIVQFFSQMSSGMIPEACFFWSFFSLRRHTASNWTLFLEDCTACVVYLFLFKKKICFFYHSPKKKKINEKGSVFCRLLVSLFGLMWINEFSCFMPRLQTFISLLSICMSKVKDACCLVTKILLKFIPLWILNMTFDGLWATHLYLPKVMWNDCSL